MTVQTFLEARGLYERIKGYSKAHKVAIPEIVGRMVEHVLSDDGADDLVSDLVSDAPKSSRGRRPLDPEERAARAAARAVKGETPEQAVKALQAAIELLRKG